MVTISNRRIHEISVEQENLFLTTVHVPGENEDAEGIVKLVISPQTVIFNGEGMSVPANALCVGMMINAVISDAMTLSLPPQTAAYEVCVL